MWSQWKLSEGWKGIHWNLIFKRIPFYEQMRFPYDSWQAGMHRGLGASSAWWLSLSKSLGAVVPSYAIIQIGHCVWLNIMGAEKHPLHRQKSKYSKFFLIISSNGSTIISKKVKDALLFLKLRNVNGSQKDTSYLNTSNIRQLLTLLYLH